MRRFMTDYEIEMELNNAAKEYKGGGIPVNLSYWNSGSEYKKQIKKIFAVEEDSDIFDYYYYLSENTQECMAKKLGFSDEDCKNERLHVFNQSTLSITTLLAFLSGLNTKLGIISPVYFSVRDCCDAFKLPYILFDNFMQDINTTFSIEALLKSDCTAFWFTSPVNSCSIYFNQRVKSEIQKLLDFGKIVIFDESLCVNGMELSRSFGAQENLIYIYSPHKPIGIQGIKFSVIAIHKKYYDEIDSLADVHSGSLNCSCRIGGSHFISKNFGECTFLYNQFWKNNFSVVKAIVDSYDFASVSKETYGHYAMIFIDRFLDDRFVVDAMKSLIKERGCFIYPGKMQGFDTKQCFCFRINLLYNRDDLERGLKVVLDYFKTTLGEAK